MPFVYIHAALFAIWMLLVESDPWPKLTLIVSLEAIFLATFVMIGQNRQAAFQQAKADHDFNEQELELKTNTELTRAIHTLTIELHRRLLGHDQQPGSRRSCALPRSHHRRCGTIASWAPLWFSGPAATSVRRSTSEC